MIHFALDGCVVILPASMIRYLITSHNPASHYFDVGIEIPAPVEAGQLLRLPNWIPGSYMIRDFARNLVDLRAFSEGTEVKLEQIDKSNWRVGESPGPLSLEYRVYSRDLSVRAAHLDHTHGYYNGSSVFLEVVGQGDEPCEVRIDKPVADYCANWRLATSPDALSYLLHSGRMRHSSITSDSRLAGRRQ